MSERGVRPALQSVYGQRLVTLIRRYMHHPDGKQGAISELCAWRALAESLLAEAAEGRDEVFRTQVEVLRSMP